MTPPFSHEDDLEVPLCVDLDGTLIASDLLWESFCAMLRARPMDLALVPFWLIRGRAALKQEIANRGEIDPAALPYRDAVLALIDVERGTGRKIVLATAADGSLARAVAAHLGVFDKVIASDGARNLKGSAKREALVELFGADRFDYVGDSTADLAVWKSARRAFVVPTHSKVVREAARDRPIVHVGKPRGGLVRDLLNAMRPQQWAKNLLILVPLIASHRLLEVPLLISALIAFVSFSLVASGVYIINDLLDLQVDRRHRSKRFRPFASGSVSIPVGGATASALLVLGVVGSLALPLPFTGWLVVYMMLATAYSFLLKRAPMIDVICLATLYSLRILAGGATVGLAISSWLLAFSMFFFLSLAFIKRYTELDQTPTIANGVVDRSYRAVDLDLIRAMGPACGLLSVLVLCLSINDPDVQLLYHRPELLWLACPILLYWIARLWLHACRGTLEGDPLLFALRDRVSYLSGFCLGLVVLFSI
jgi:4-hydroxybenzoate polyprenyltransferase/phosphoserine phosphatase